MMKKKILVTGANGQVGRSLQEIANNDTYEFDFVDRNQLDITNRSQVIDLISTNKYDIIVNCAAYTAVDAAEEDRDNCFAVNRDGVLYLAEACASLAQRNPLFIHISSDYVYHPEHNQPMDEEEKTNPKSIYASSKLAGEKAALNTHDNTFILRTSWVYAKVGKNFVNTIKRLSAERDQLSIVDDQIGSPTYALDIAELISAVINMYLSNESHNFHGVYNFCNKGHTSWHTFAKEITNICNHTCKLQGIPSSDYPTAAERPLNSRLITDKIEKLIGQPIRSWQDALNDCLAKE